MNFFCLSFALNQKYRAANFFRLIAANQAENKPPQKTARKLLRKIMRKLHSVEEKGLLMQYHSINIEKTAEAIKK